MTKSQMVDALVAATDGVRCPVCRGRTHEPEVLWYANEENVERCADAFHAISARKDAIDLALQSSGNAAPDANGAQPGIPVSESPAPQDMASKGLLERIAALPIGMVSRAVLLESPPFDPRPPKLETGGYGFRMCHACSTVVDASVGHECEVPAITLASRVLTERVRAEFAESVLCAMAFDHQAMLRGIYVDGPDDAHAMLTLMCGVAGECPFCDAARGE